MNYSDLKLQMRISLLGNPGTIIELDDVRERCTVQYDSGKVSIYKDSIRIFVPISDVYADITPRSITVASSVLAKVRSDKQAEQDFFRKVPQGHCACGIVRSQCNYHG